MTRMGRGRVASMKRHLDPFPNPPRALDSPTPMADMMDFEVIRTEAEGARFLEQLSQAVDDNPKEFGFVPRSMYPARLRAGGLWIVVRGSDYAGHVMFGGVLPTLKIQQLFIPLPHRGRGLSRKLIDELVDHAELEGYSSIRARVAQDLPANTAWERLGFQIHRTVAGGVTTGRIINVRLRRIHPRGAQTHMLDFFDGLVERRFPVARGLPSTGYTGTRSTSMSF